jgi:folate-binding Fe-S cluster repair protein YgfZ
VTARTRYRGLLKRRYIPFVATTDIAVPADIHANDKLAGETLAIVKDGDGWIGLANIRLDALDTGQTLMVGTDQIIPLTVAESTTKA